MKSISLILISLISYAAANAQYVPVIFNYERTQFNDGKPLPAETYFVLSGAVNQQVTMVEAKLYGRNSDLKKSPLYVKNWKREFKNSSERFELPINYKLRSENEYDVYISYYRLATTEEIKNLKDELFLSLDSYIDQNLVFSKKKIALMKKSGRMLDDMNTIVNSALSYYRSPTEMKFEGFSDLVLDKINLIEKTRQDKTLGRRADESENLTQKEKHLVELKVRVHSEVAHLLNANLSVLADTKFVDDYLVDNVQRFVTLHAGFGGTYLEGDVQSGSFGTSAMVGITLPLGKKAFASEFLANSSFIVGVNLKNFVSDQGDVLTGPIIQRPIYVGVGYKMLQFMRLSTGVTVLENNSNAIYVRPFVGLTADFNLWLDTGK